LHPIHHGRIESGCRLDEETEWNEEEVQASKIGLVPPSHIVVGDQALDNAITGCSDYRSHGERCRTMLEKNAASRADWQVKKRPKSTIYNSSEDNKVIPSRWRSKPSSAPTPL
jgi:hypothetical protein